MFYGTNLPRVAYEDPWNEPLEDRLQALLAPRAVRRVAYLYERPDTSTFRYRVFNMIQSLHTTAEVAAAWFAEYEIAHLLPFVERCDALVLCRVRYSEPVARLLAVAHFRGVDTVFDVDDLIFDTDYTHAIVDALDQPINSRTWDFWFACIGRLGATLRLCRRIIVTNEYLAGKAAEFAPEKPVDVIPNFLNHEQVVISNRILDAKRGCAFVSDGRIHLGYFSGTPSHNRDFAVITDALKRVLDADKRLVLRVVGFLDLTAKLAGHADRIERFPLQDFINLQRLIGETEINLVPLQDNAFTNCKSELKYFEAAVTGTVTVATPIFSYRNSICSGVNGWLANAHQWTETILTAIADREKYAAMAEAANAHSLENYAPDARADRIAGVLFGEDFASRLSISARSAAPLISPPDYRTNGLASIS